MRLTSIQTLIKLILAQKSNLPIR